MEKSEFSQGGGGTWTWTGHNDPDWMTEGCSIAGGKNMDIQTNMHPCLCVLYNIYTKNFRVVFLNV